MSGEVKCSECGAVQGERDHKMDCSVGRSMTDPECRSCWIGPAYGPSHNGYSCCRQFRRTGHGAIAAGGTVAHCTCAGCF